MAMRKVGRGNDRDRSTYKYGINTIKTASIDLRLEASRTVSTNWLQTTKLE
jgi:hypothetical protein